MTRRSRFTAARRCEIIEPFQVMALLARAKALEAQGKDIVHMEIGEPDFPTPKNIIDAGVQALQQNLTHYTSAQGLPELRAKISHYYAARYGASVAAERIFITPGASGALLLALSLILDEGQSVLVTDPGYPCNRHLIHSLNGLACPVPLSGDNAFRLDMQEVERRWTDDTVAMMIASPSNPLGTVTPDTVIQQLIELARNRHGYLVVDEIYHELVYGKLQPASALAFADDVFVINSFSKYFCMTGWRLGWLVVPEEFIAVADKLAQNLFLAPSTIAQYAALAAFGNETITVLEQYRAIFAQRRDVLLKGLKELGFGIPVEPEGAFYIYADSSKFTPDSFDFSQRLLEEAGVALTPGLDFGQRDAQRYLRFAYTTSVARIELGLSRLATFLN